jgi:hypothetical protein
MLTFNSPPFFFCRSGQIISTVFHPFKIHQHTKFYLSICFVVFVCIFYIFIIYSTSYFILTHGSMECILICMYLQILPQMLNYLGLDSTEKSVDWGTLAVYTCSQSCNEGPAYKQEFLWKQDIVS